MLTINNILNQIPLFIAEDPYIKNILLAKAKEFETADEFREDILKQFNVDTATWGLILWEKALMLPSPDTYGDKVLIEENDPIIHYHGSWYNSNLYNEDPNFDNNKGNSNGLIKYCNANDNNSWFEFTFYGTGIRFIRSSAMFERSRCEIYIDNEKFDANNQTEANPIYNFCFFEKQNLYWGLHTVRVIPYGLASGSDRRESFVLDRLEITNDLAQEYDNRRAIIKAKLIPITLVTNDTVKEIAKSYGFNNIVIDESEPFIYKIDFDHNANVDYSLRKKMLDDLQELIPAHIELDNKFFISTFYDIMNHLLTWDMANAAYVWYDFLTKNKPDITEIFNYLNKYLDNSVFNYKSFNSDTNLIDSLYQGNVLDNSHFYNTIINNNVLYNNISGIPNKFNDINKKLLIDSKRSILSRITNKTNLDNKTITILIDNFVSARNKLKLAINEHPFLKANGVNESSNEFSDLLRHVVLFQTGTSGLTGTVNSSSQVLEGKVAFNGTNYITGNIPVLNLNDFYKNITNYPNGYNRQKIAIKESYTIPKQVDLLPENIRRGYSIFGVLGTFDSIPNDYNKGDTLFEWQLQDEGTSFKILS